MIDENFLFVLLVDRLLRLVHDDGRCRLPAIATGDSLTLADTSRNGRSGGTAERLKPCWFMIVSNYPKERKIKGESGHLRLRILCQLKSSVDVSHLDGHKPTSFLV